MRRSFFTSLRHDTFVLLTIFIGIGLYDWVSLLPIAEFAYRQAMHATMGCSPFKAMYGYDPVLELRLEDETAEGEVPAAKERVKEINSIR